MRRCGFPKPAAGIRRQTPDSGSGRISVQRRKSASSAAKHPGRRRKDVKSEKYEKMAVKYYTDDCSYRLPQKRLTAEWLRRVAEAEG